MNKKTIGKVAALALACASVVPTFGVVASADVAYDYSTSSISGSAYRISWTVVKKSTVLTADFNETTNSVTFRTTSYSESALTDANDITVENGTAPAEKGAGSVYVTTSTQANTMSSNITSAIKAQASYASTAESNWKKAWNNYASDCKKFDAAYNSLTATKTEATYTNSDNETVTVTSSSSKSTIVTKPSEATATLSYYTYSGAPSIESKTMKQLVDELGARVKITNGVIEYAADGTYTVNTTGTSTSTDTGTTTTGSYIPSSAYRYATATVYQSNVTGLYYPNHSALYNVEGSVAYTTRAPYTYYSATYCYFDANDGTYRASNLDDYTYYVSSGTTTDSNAIYKVNGYYYATYSDAYSAASGDTSKITYVEDYTTSYDYFSNVTGKFYSTYYAALVASNGNSSRVDVFNGASTDYYNYYDPYYYYYLNGYSYNYNTNSSSSNSGTATMGKKTGWTSIAKSLSSTNAGSTVTVSMNDEETIPSTVLSAIKGKNVTVKFVLDNGVTYTVNGKDVTTAKDVDINTTYNTKNVSSKLVKAAVKKNDGVSSAQISIDSASLGFTSDVTVKLPSKRAGYSAKLYRYNSSKNSLVLVDTATVKSSGKCTFENVTKGGDFVIVVY